MKRVGVCSASMRMRDSAGWMRWPSASKSWRPVRVEEHDLPVEHVAARREAQLGEVARQRPPVARLQVDVVAVHEGDRAEAVPLRLVHPAAAGRQRLGGLGELGEERRREGKRHRSRDAIPRAGVLRPARARVRRLVPRHRPVRRPRPAGLAGEVEALTGALAALPPARTLDVACGTGFLTRHLPGEVWGLDRSAADARRRARAAPRPAGSWRATRSPCRSPTAPFARIAAGHFYGHLEPAERERFLAEAARVGRELLVVDSARRPDVPAERWDPRVLSDGSRHAVFKRWFTPAGARRRARRRRGRPRGRVVRGRAAGVESRGSRTPSDWGGRDEEAHPGGSRRAGRRTRRRRARARPRRRRSGRSTTTPSPAPATSTSRM